MKSLYKIPKIDIVSCIVSQFSNLSACSVGIKKLLIGYIFSIHFCKSNKYILIFHPKNTNIQNFFKITQHEFRAVFGLSGLGPFKFFSKLYDKSIRIRSLSQNSTKKFELMFNISKYFQFPQILQHFKDSLNS